MSSKGTVLSVNVSLEKGVIKTPVLHVNVDNLGIIGDAHAGKWHRQISLLSHEQIDAFSKETGKEIMPGQFAENESLGNGIARQAVGAVGAADSLPRRE